MRKDATKIWQWCGIALAMLFAMPGFAQDGAQHGAQPDPAELLRFVQTPWGQDSRQGIEEPEPRYGQEDYDSWVIGYTAAYETEAFDQGITLSYNRFLVKDIEWLVEGGLWSFYDRGNDAAYGLSAGIGFRWHFLTRERWSLFADIGISLLGTTDAVPPEGTEFNFMPRAGLGFTHKIDENIRLIGGVRWHHISNARTRGDARNPARDAPSIYVGLIVPF